MSKFPLVQHLLHYANIGELPRHHQIIIAALTAGSISLATYLASSYRGWLALGRGGLPYNPLGYLMNLAMQPLARRDLRAPAPYALEDLEHLYGPLGRRSFLDGASPPERVGPRPDIPSYVAPQRQISERATPEMILRMQSFLDTLVADNHEILTMRPSGLEGPLYNAVWLSDSDSDILSARPRFLKGTKGEFVHVHSEGSTHVVLSLADATTAIQSFWAERHGLSGVLDGKKLPWSYVLVYAPRDEAEFKVWQRFVIASTRFITTAAGGPKDIEIPTLSGESK